MVRQSRARRWTGNVFGGHPPIDFISLADLSRHDRMVALVECTAEGVDLHKELASEGAPHVVTVLQRHAKAEATDRDAFGGPLVYELYGLSDDEIAIVAGRRLTAAL